MSTPPLSPLVTAVRSAHPGAYDDLDDASLEKAVLAKYPQYSDMAAPSLANAPGAPPSRSQLTKTIDSGEGPVAQGMTTMETKLSQVPQNTASSLYHSFVDKPTNGASILDNPSRLNPIDTKEGSLAQNVGGTAANIFPAVIDPMGGGIGDSVLGTLTKAAADASLPMRSATAQKLISPMTYENVGETAADVRMGANPERGIVNEGLVGTKEGLLPKIDSRLTQLKSAANNILDNHPNSLQPLDAEPHIDAAIDNAIQEAQRTGADTSRLESIRAALKTKYGNLQGTPRQMNDLKTEIQDAANGLGAYKNTQPVEASAANAMSAAANRIKTMVNDSVPEAAELNQRMQDLQDARQGIQRQVNKARGEDIFAPHEPLTSVGSKILSRTAGSAPVRTGIARVLNAGNVKGVPAPGPLAGIGAPLTLTPPPGQTPPAPNAQEPLDLAGGEEIPARATPDIFGRGLISKEPLIMSPPGQMPVDLQRVLGFTQEEGGAPPSEAHPGVHPKNLPKGKKK
jgi:hypothetical protein